MKRILAALPFLLALGACSTSPSVTITPATVSATVPVQAPAPAPNDPLAKLSAFTLADLQAASVDAHAQTPPDQTAYQCYDFLIQVLPTIKAPGGMSTVGAVLAYQKLRDLKNGVAASGGTLKSLNLACAPLVIDTQTTVNQLILLGSGAAATGGALAPLPIPLP